MVHQRFNLSPLIALCSITHVHIVLPYMLDYILCHYLVWYSVSLIKMSSGVGVCKCLTEYFFLCVHTLYHVLQLGAFLLYALILLWQKAAIILHAAHKKTDLCAVHEALLTCFLPLCITQIITLVQHT